jgi:dynactin-4
MRDAQNRADRDRALLPQRIPLQTKLTKRCPAPTCRHLLIQPDSKSTRMKIKMVAANYLPAVELGRRRRRIVPGDVSEVSAEDVERRRRERRKTRGAKEEDEVMTEPLGPGEVVRDCETVTRSDNVSR